MEAEFTGKTVVITGGSSGIGARTAELFASRGATVVITGLRAAEGREYAAKLGGIFIRADVSVETEVRAMVHMVLDRYGRLDVLVNNAGSPGVFGDVADVNLKAFEQTWSVHVGGVMIGMKHVVGPMRARGTGSIVNVASIAGHIAGWSGLAYSAAKAAVVQLTRCAAVELGAYGIRVNSVSPGVILTGIFAKGVGMAPDEADRAVAELEPVVRNRTKDWQAIDRVGRTDDIAKAIVWLASDEAAFVSGHDLVVDGGVSAGRPSSIGRAERADLIRALDRMSTAVNGTQARPA
jgi:NAD(P)-dependent dehydrogenase (short-subunit alcohol dehydrogenase family)